MQVLRSPQEAYRKIDFDARVAGADPVQLVMLCYEQLASALGTAVHADQHRDNARKSAALTRTLSALTALQMGLDRELPIAGALSTLFEGARKTVLVPTSAHGTNPATAALAGYGVVEVAQTADGRVDVADLAAKLGPHIAAVMVTNPNTCGLFERDVLEISKLTHAAGADR